MTRSRDGRPIAYLIALLGIGVATVIRFALDPILGEHLIFSVYYLGVSVAAWAGGLRPALTAAVLSSLLANFLFSAPRGSLNLSSGEELCAQILFLCVSTVIGILSELSIRSMARARVAEQQKDDFLAILAHELRNPLAIIHYANLAEHRADARDGRGRAEVIDRQVRQLDQMIDDLMDIARVAKGKFRLHFKQFDAANIVDGALDKVRHLVDARGHELNVRRADRRLPVYGDPLRLQQALTNLLIHAAKFTPRGGRIDFEVASHNGAAVFRVRDNGEGIAKEMLSRVFDLRTQIERSLERSGSDLGIGLTLVRTLVELHGGTVSATSEGVNLGSEFVVRLPLDQQESKARSGRSS